MREEAQVDYGSGPMVRDAQSGKYRRTRLFVLTLGYSRKSVRLLVWRSSARIWAELHEKYPQMRAAELEDQVAGGTMSSAPKTARKPRREPWETLRKCNHGHISHPGVIARRVVSQYSSMILYGLKSLFFRETKGWQGRLYL
jgi:hypothetical protein